MLYCLNNKNCYLNNTTKQANYIVFSLVITTSQQFVKYKPQLLLSNKLERERERERERDSTYGVRFCEFYSLPSDQTPIEFWYR